MTNSHIEQSPSKGEVVARRTREIREHRGWLQADFLNRLDALGHHMEQATLSRIENGVRRVTVDELVLLALALDVSPAHLVVPVDQTARVELAPGTVERAVDVLRWFTGRQALRDTDAKVYAREMPKAARADAALMLRATEHFGEQATSRKGGSR
jgi:transcriptional regulator with XRE-family HTH domain